MAGTSDQWTGYAKRHLKSVQVRDRRLVLDFD